MKNLLTEVPRVAIVLSNAYKTSRELIQGIMRYAQLHGPWAINVFEGRPFEQGIDDFSQWGCTGMIGSLNTPWIREKLQKCKFPIVSTHPISDLRPSCRKTLSTKYLAAMLDCDNIAFAKAAARYFLESGHTRFAYVGEPHGIRWSTERSKAFARCIKEAGFGCSVYPLAPMAMRNDVVQEGRRLREWLQGLPRHTALFVAHDNRARQVLDLCLEAKIAVPGHLSVLSCDNDELICETSVPKLSSIAADTIAAGFSAAETLDRAMRQDRSEWMGRPATILYGCTQIVARASSDKIGCEDPLVLKALDCIRLNVTKKIRVEELAQSLRVSTRMLEKHFRQSLGKTIEHEIMRIRMELAQHLLANSTDTLDTVAEQCGFAAASHLCTSFRRHFGTTPSSIRHHR